MKIKDIARIITTPNCWIRNSFTDSAWDKELNAILDAHNFFPHSNCRIKLYEVEIWIENYPYAFGGKGLYGRVPSRTTVFRLHDILVWHGILK